MITKCSSVPVVLAIVFAIVATVMLIMFLVERNKTPKKFHTYRELLIEPSPGASLQHTVRGPFCVTGDLKVNVPGVPEYEKYKDLEWNEQKLEVKVNDLTPGNRFSTSYGPICFAAGVDISCRCNPAQ